MKKLNWETTKEIISNLSYAPDSERVKKMNSLSDKLFKEILFFFPKYIKYATSSSETVQIFAFLHGADFEMIVNPCERVKLMRVSDVPNAIFDMDSYSDEVLIEAFSHYRFDGIYKIPRERMTEKVILAACKRNFYTIFDFQRHGFMTEDLAIKIVSRSAARIQQFHDPSEAIQLAAVRKSPSIIKLIKNPCVSVQHEAVSLNPEVAKYVRGAVDEIKMMAKLISKPKGR
jgi:hypothetical protein